MKIFGVEFAPLFIPTERRLQTLAVIQWVASFLILGFACTFFMIYLIFTRYGKSLVIQQQVSFRDLQFSLQFCDLYKHFEESCRFCGMRPLKAFYKTIVQTTTLGVYIWWNHKPVELGYLAYPASIHLTCTMVTDSY